VLGKGKKADIGKDYEKPPPMPNTGAGGSSQGTLLIANVTQSLPESALVHNTDVSRQKGEQLLEAHCKTSGKSTQASDGLFLLRASAKTKGAVVISMLCSSKSHHFNFGPSGSVENPPRYLNDSGRNVGMVHELIAHYKQKHTGGPPCALRELLTPPAF